MSFLEVNGAALAFAEAGGGELTPLVFVHGHPFDRTMWRPQLQAFAGSGRRLLAADLRGYGQSETTPGKVGLDIFAGDLAALLAARGIEGPVVVCGLSMGGQIAMEFCRRFPERVAGLVLAATTPQAETEAGKRATPWPTGCWPKGFGRTLTRRLRRCCRPRASPLCRRSPPKSSR